MTQCAVRRLRVAAASEPAARRFVTTLEDALRCATLPGDDRRVVVVRRFDLGRVAHDAGTQGLGLLIEQRLARGEIAWSSTDAAPDSHADAVGFADALEARVQLARRLVRGETCDAWYWPLAVRECRRDLAPREALRRMAQAIAALPEGRVALPQWIARVVDAGGADALCAAIDEPVARALLREARIARPDDAAAAMASRRSGAQSTGTDTDHATVRGGSSTRSTRTSDAASRSTWPEWLVTILSRAYGSAYPSAPGTAPAGDDGGVHGRKRSAPFAANESPSTADSDEQLPEAGSQVPDAAPGAPMLEPTSHPREPAPPDMRIARPVPSRTSTASPDADGHWRPTACGGLLFLLPVLAHAGIVPGDDPDGDRLAALRVLRAALRRVRAADDDAAWTLVADLPKLLPPEARAAEPRALRDLATTRRWLHRHARLGLVTLVRRPARLAFTPTHIDVRFPLVGADVRIRRVGLDLDPGWLPWFGRVVAFQFIGRQP